MMTEQNRGRIHVYAGDGKGKTTAAVGLTVRAAARGFKIRFVQFLKSGNSAELTVLRELPNVTVVTGQKIGKFSFLMDESERTITRELHQQYLAEAIQAASDDSLDLLVLDEALGAIQAGLLDEASVLAFLRNKPTVLEVVLTGRDPSEEIIALADYYSEVCCRKHPYETEQLDARPGIEY